jgi:hypothetical protein
MLQRFTPDGTKSGDEVRVSTTDVNADHGPAIARLSDLTFVVCWVSAQRPQYRLPAGGCGDARSTLHGGVDRREGAPPRRYDRPEHQGRAVLRDRRRARCIRDPGQRLGDRRSDLSVRGDHRGRTGRGHGRRLGRRRRVRRRFITACGEGTSTCQRSEPSVASSGSTTALSASRHRNPVAKLRSISTVGKSMNFGRGQPRGGGQVGGGAAGHQVA